MLRNLSILLAAALVIALPFAFRRPEQATNWKPGDPVLVIVTPHNEAIRSEFDRAFSRWHQARFGQPVRIDWRAIGGTTEIMRYLSSEFVASARAWWTAQRRPWRAALGEAMTDRKLDLQHPPSPEALELWTRFRALDDATTISSGLDLFFGGGEYDHQVAFGQGLTVAPWPADQPPPGLFTTAVGEVLIPKRISGETWWSDTYFSTCASTFGICYNVDRLRDLGIMQPPTQWADLADPRYRGTLGLADPTKSGSIAKVFELIIHQQCHRAVAAAGYADAQIGDFEAAIRDARLPPGQMPPAVPARYQQAIETGWLDGLRLVQQLGANARYFTDSGSKVPIDVSCGQASAGLSIDFYSRFQAQSSVDAQGREHMGFVTPLGGTGASGDPISLLRGAPHRVLAARFIEFVLSEEGQRLWCYRPGTPGGPVQYALRRLPVRRDFYPSPLPAFQAAHARHAVHSTDDLTDPHINPYAVAQQFTYYPRWTTQHFSILRDLVRAMCIDSEAELKSAWDALIAAGGPSQQPDLAARLAELPRLPEPVTWASALGYARAHDRLDYLRAWTEEYRARYRSITIEATRRANTIPGIAGAAHGAATTPSESGVAAPPRGAIRAAHGAATTPPESGVVAPPRGAVVMVGARGP